MKTELQVATEALHALESRLVAMERERHDLAEAVEGIRAKLIDPESTIDKSFRKESIAIRARLEDVEETLDGLRSAIADRRTEVERLTLQSEKERVAGICRTVEASYADLAAELKEAVMPQLTDWLKAAAEASGQYTTVNERANPQLDSKRYQIGLLLEAIKGA